MNPVTYDKEKIYINGVPTKIVSGAMHYFRIMPEYWYDRLLKLKECGCNCVETYICWNLHEKKQGEFDFKDGLDFIRFLKTAQDLGLYAIVRPGPYICSEWDFGGMPWWLLKYNDIELRCNNERYKELCKPYLQKVCELLKPQLISNGGNVIFLQIENEYGSYGNDKEYLNWIKKLYEESGMDCGYLTSDGDTDFCLINGSADGVLASVNYRWDSKNAVAALKSFRDDQPGAVLELWNGKAVHWEEKFERRDIAEVKDSVKTALEYAELINLYMFHGGTSFGFMNGSLDFGEKLVVQMTSYDVDAPLDEYGRRTKKYYAEQEEICKAMGTEINNTATDTVLAEFKDIKFVGATSLKQSGLKLKSFKTPVTKNMEYFDQGYGYIIYETEAFVDDKGAEIVLPEIHDIAHIYIDGIYTKTLLRHSESKIVSIEGKGKHTVSIVVENMGRVNYGIRLKDYKGLVGDLCIHDLRYNMYTRLMNINTYSLPLDELPENYGGEISENEPGFYKYELNVDKAQDTVMHLEGFTRGVAFINGFNLGRHWDTPLSDNKLFIPAPLIKEGKNEIVVFDILHKNAEKKLIFGENK